MCDVYLHASTQEWGVWGDAPPGKLDALRLLLWSLSDKSGDVVAII